MNRSHDYLFAQGDAHAVQQHQLHHFNAEIAQIDSNRLLNTNLDALVDYFVEKYRVEAACNRRPASLRPQVRLAKNGNVVWIASRVASMPSFSAVAAGTDWRQTVAPHGVPSVGAFDNLLASYWGKETSDPEKVPRLVLGLANSDSLPVHLLAGTAPA